MIVRSTFMVADMFTYPTVAFYDCTCYLYGCWYVYIPYCSLLWLYVLPLRLLIWRYCHNSEPWLDETDTSLTSINVCLYNCSSVLPLLYPPVWMLYTPFAVCMSVWMPKGPCLDFCSCNCFMVSCAFINERICERSLEFVEYVEPKRKLRA